MPNRKNTLEVFWSRVVRGPGCWAYCGPREGFPNGYPQFRYQGKYWLASRLAWTATFGPIADGLFVCHHCDNPLCVRPEHLFLGTSDDNNKDKAKKGRARGGGPKLRKLTDAQLDEAFAEYLSGRTSMRELSRKYDFSQPKFSRWFARFYAERGIARPQFNRGGKVPKKQTGITLPRL